MLSVGIVGLPNVGKSSLFNALTAAGAPAENYPFCTVDPNIGTVEVPDPRLDRIHTLCGSPRRVPTVIQFVDIAGLVRGASDGEGLGNQFLANIRDVDAIAHVLRCFDDPDVAHVSGRVDPLRDRGIVETELALADLDTVERRLDKVEKKARSGDEDARTEREALIRARDALSRAVPLRRAELTAEERAILRRIQPLTEKPMLYVANIGEDDLPDGRNEWTARLAEAMHEEDAEEMVSVCSAMEAELAELDAPERAEFLEAMGLRERGLDRFVRSAYHLLGLITFFTTGPKESRAWTIRRGARAPEAAGLIHSDFERGFIRAKTIGYDEFIELGSLKAARNQGRIRSEGKDYVVEDGDILLFRFNV